MVADEEIAAFVEKYHRALDAFFRGDPDLTKQRYSHREATGFDSLVTHVTPQLAYLVEVERFEAKVVAERRWLRARSG